MIDPTRMTRCGLRRPQLEEVILFSVLAANSNAKVSAERLEMMLSWLKKSRPRRRFSPFGWIRDFLSYSDVVNLRHFMRGLKSNREIDDTGR